MSCRCLIHADMPHAVNRRVAKRLPAVTFVRTVATVSCRKLRAKTLDESENGWSADESNSESGLVAPGQALNAVTTVYKFGGSSVATASRMHKVAEIVCAFPEHFPAVVISAMGKTTNLLLEAGNLAVSSGTEAVPTLAPLRAIMTLHRDTCEALACDAGTVAAVERLLTELQQLLTGIAIMQEVTPRAKDSLVSFGERLSTRIFASFLRAQGVPARQFDAWDLGLVTSDEFTNAEIQYTPSLVAVRRTVAAHVAATRELPIITGFLGRGVNTGAITTLGRGGSDLTATFVGAALGVEEVVVWKDVDGVLTSDPRLVRDARVISTLTYEEATELAYFGAQVLHPAAMYPAELSGGRLTVRVKNSYNLAAEGSSICSQRDMTNALLSSIVLKPDVTLLDIGSTRMLGNFGFLARVFEVFKQEEISVDVVATSEVSVSVTLDCARMWSRELVSEELTHLQAQLKGIANVRVQRGVSIVSLICNVEKSSVILHRVFAVLRDLSINVKMMSQGASKTNISLILLADQAPAAVVALHAEFFGVTDNCAASEEALNKAVPAQMS